MVRARPPGAPVRGRGRGIPGSDADDPVARKAELVADYRDTFANPYRAANLGYIDEVLLPRDTRSRLIEAFDSLENKRDTNPPKKHGNIPI